MQFACSKKNVKGKNCAGECCSCPTEGIHSMKSGKRRERERDETRTQFLLQRIVLHLTIGRNRGAIVLKETVNKRLTSLCRRNPVVWFKALLFPYSLPSSSGISLPDFPGRLLLAGSRTRMWRTRTRS